MATRRRKVQGREDAERLLAAWDDGSHGLPEYSARAGVDGRSLHYWAGTLGRLPREPRASEVALVELAVRSAPAAVYRVVVGGYAVEVDDAFREDTLSRLLRVVARC